MTWFDYFVIGLNINDLLTALGLTLFGIICVCILINEERKGEQND